MKQILILLFSFAVIQAYGQKKVSANKGVFLENISWTTAKELLTPDAVVVIPLGAQAKEHGPHLPLSTDFLQATDAARRLAMQRKVIIAPPINYGYYFAFIKYPGSTSLSFATSTETVLQVIRSLANYGPKRFYIINIGISTTPTLELAAKILAESGILLVFSDYNKPAFAAALHPIATKNYGGHADEIETSSILAIRSDLVDMTKAVDDSSNKGKRGVWTPVEMEGGVLNKSGINGYATLATKAKGEKVMKAFTSVLIKEIDSIATCALPALKHHETEFKVYEGLYTDSSGTKLKISQRNNTLYFVLNDRDLRNFYPLYKDADDYFTSTPMNILFVKNEVGDVLKAWCQNTGKSFWLKKAK